MTFEEANKLFFGFVSTGFFQIITVLHQLYGNNIFHFMNGIFYRRHELVNA